MKKSILLQNDIKVADQNDIELTNTQPKNVQQNDTDEWRTRNRMATFNSEKFISAKFLLAESQVTSNFYLKRKVRSQID